jgi:hypothetical protein
MRINQEPGSHREHVTPTPLPGSGVFFVLAKRKKIGNFWPWMFQFSLAGLWLNLLVWLV